MHNLSYIVDLYSIHKCTCNVEKRKIASSLTKLHTMVNQMTCILSSIIQRLPNFISLYIQKNKNLEIVL